MIVLFEDFEKEVKEELQRRLGNVKPISDVVLKNNGMKLHALSLTAEGEKLGVYVYLDVLYSKFIKGELDILGAVDIIVNQYVEGKNNFAFDVSAISEYENVKKLIRGRLVNTERNEEVLCKVPHREFLDLSIIYSIDLRQSDGKGIGSIRISNELMESCKVDEESLYYQMMENMQESAEGNVLSMESVLGELCGAIMEAARPSFPMYVISNRQKVNGAIEILNRNILEKAAIMLGEDFWVLPSSIHEWILLPMRNKQEDKEYIRSMVREINDTQVAYEEVLSNNLYIYRQATGKIEIAT